MMNENEHGHGDGMSSEDFWYIKQKADYEI